MERSKEPMWGVIVALVVAVAFLLWWNGFETGYRRLRLKVVMDTPSGRIERSGVVETKYRSTTDMGSSVTYTLLRGEAVPIDLPDGRTIYMAVDKTGWDWTQMMPWVAGPHRRNVDAGYEVSIDPRYLPSFMGFRDERRPASVYEINPFAAWRTLGHGYAVRRVTVQRTRDDPTTGILKRLPWAKDMRGNLLGSFAGNSRSTASSTNRNFFYRKS